MLSTFCSRRDISGTCEITATYENDCFFQGVYGDICNSERELGEERLSNNYCVIV